MSRRQGIVSFVLDMIQAYLGCLPCLTRRRPPSPPLDPLEGELETLLGGPSDFSLKVTGRRRMLSEESEGEREGDQFREEGDARELDERDVQRFMGRLEPGLSLSDIEREEREEAERQERSMGRVGRIDSGRGGNEREEDEFGGFHTAATTATGHQSYKNEETKAYEYGSEGDEEAEVSFALGAEEGSDIDA